MGWHPASVRFFAAVSRVGKCPLPAAHAKRSDTRHGVKKRPYRLRRKLRREPQRHSQSAATSRRVFAAAGTEPSSPLAACLRSSRAKRPAEFWRLDEFPRRTFALGKTWARAVARWSGRGARRPPCHEGVPHDETKQTVRRPRCADPSGKRRTLGPRNPAFLYGRGPADPRRPDPADAVGRVPPRRVAAGRSPCEAFAGQGSLGAVAEPVGFARADLRRRRVGSTARPGPVGPGDCGNRQAERRLRGAGLGPAVSGRCALARPRRRHARGQRIPRGPGRVAQRLDHRLFLRRVRQRRHGAAILGTFPRWPSPSATTRTIVPT